MVTCAFGLKTVLSQPVARDMDNVKCKRKFACCANTLCELFVDAVLKLQDGLYFIPRESRGESHFLLSA